MPSIKRRASTLEARIAEAEMRCPDRGGIPDAVFEAYNHAATVLVCFCATDGGTPEAIQSCLLQRGLSEADAEHYAGMTYSEARDEVMAAPALDITF